LFAPNYDYSGEAAMCGPNGTLPLFPTKTLKVAAGSIFGFGVAPQSRNGSDESKDMRNVCTLITSGIDWVSEEC